MRLIRLTVLALCAILILGATQASAKITLKNSFWKGWSYSVDGLKYLKVGNSGEGLRLAMRDNDEAVALMRSYEAAKYWEVRLSVPGRLLVAWPLVGFITGSEWRNESTVMLSIGAAFETISLLYGSSASNKLTKAVAIYNGDEEQPLGFMFDIRPPEAGQPGAVIAGLRYGF